VARVRAGGSVVSSLVSSFCLPVLAAGSRAKMVAEAAARSSVSTVILASVTRAGARAGAITTGSSSSATGANFVCGVAVEFGFCDRFQFEAVVTAWRGAAAVPIYSS
jgi:hypothetical protein